MSSQYKALVIDDAPSSRSLQTEATANRFELDCCRSDEELDRLLSASDCKYDLILVDYELRGPTSSFQKYENGPAVTEQLISRFAELSIVGISKFLTEKSPAEQHVKLSAWMLAGCAWWLDTDELKSQLGWNKHGGSLRALAERTRFRRAKMAPSKAATEPVFPKDLLERAARAAKHRVPVMLKGETGVGKEVMAKHLAGLVADSKSFVSVNCAAIPPTLFESEFFGHEKGAFTGATERRIGYFERAHNGVLFLDEIGDLELSAQAKVLRALEYGTFYRVGGVNEISSTPRLVISATNLPLNRLVVEKKFRLDLLHRLNVIPLHVLPLRDRLDELPQLINQILDDVRRVQDKNVDFLDIERCVEWFAKYFTNQLPETSGNIRELKHLIHRIVCLAPEDAVGVEDFDRLALLDSEVTAAPSGAQPPLLDKQVDFDQKFYEMVPDLITLLGNPDDRSVTSKAGLIKRGIERIKKQFRIGSTVSVDPDRLENRLRKDRKDLWEEMGRVSPRKSPTANTNRPQD